MSEEEIIKIIQELKDGVERYGFDYTVEETVVINKNEYDAIQGLLDLYNKEKEKNKLLIQGKFREVADKSSYIKDVYVSKDKLKEIIYEDYGATIYDYHCDYEGSFDRIENLLKM